MSPAESAAPRPSEGGRAVLRSDGAARGNPGPAAIAYVLLDEHGRELAAEGRAIGRATNNEAEYHALIAGLERAAALGLRSLDVRLDSELVVLQLTGRYRVRSAHLVPLHQRARALLAGFAATTIRHVPRGRNARADQLANTALDAAQGRRAPPGAGQVGK